MQCFKAHTFFCRLEEKGLCCCFLTFAGEPTAFIRQTNFIYVFLILILLTTWHSGGTSENSAHQSLLPKYQKPSRSFTVSKGL